MVYILYIMLSARKSTHNYFKQLSSLLFVRNDLSKLLLLSPLYTYYCSYHIVYAPPRVVDAISTIKLMCKIYLNFNASSAKGRILHTVSLFTAHAKCATITCYIKSHSLITHNGTYNAGVISHVN